MIAGGISGGISGGFLAKWKQNNKKKIETYCRSHSKDNTEFMHCLMLGNKGLGMELQKAKAKAKKAKKK